MLFKELERIFLLISFIASSEVYAFVHVSIDQPRLPSTREAPEVRFFWDGSIPSIKGKESFESGAYAHLSDEEFFQTLLNLAFERWNSIEGSYLRMRVDVDTNASVDGEDSLNSIVVKKIDNLSAAAFAQPINRSNKSESEQTELEKDPKIIHDCDITISDISMEVKSLYSVLIHEIGHCVGLGHPHTNYNSIMSYARQDGATTLGLDDMAGTIFLYPENEDETKELVACGTLGGGKQLFILSCLFLLPLFMALQPKRKPPSL